MSRNKKYLIVFLIVASVLLAGLSIAITVSISNQRLETITDAQTNAILANCNSATNICSIPAGVCGPSKVFVHFCNDLKRDNEKCISTTPLEIPTSPVSSGSSVNLNDYLGEVNCGTVQMYLELETSGVNSLGACGTTVKRFASACTGSNNQPVSFPVSFPTGTTQPTNNQGNTNNQNNNQNNNPGQQLAQPQFSINNVVAPSCDSSGAAVFNFTISVTNVSSVSGTITKVEEQIDSRLTANSITPSSISSVGDFANGKIAWVENLTQRTYNANQTKTFTYRVTIPKEKLSIFADGVNSVSTVIYDTANTMGNTSTFVLKATNNCPIPTTNTFNNTTPLPNTSVGSNFALLISGLSLILAAVIIFRFRIGEQLIKRIFIKKE